MNTNNYSNPVFTLIKPGDLPPEQAEDIEPDDSRGNEYTKAVEDSYDASYFTDEDTGLFRFPNYNKSPKGLVKIKDVTRYKEDYFTFLDSGQKKAYTIDQFEYHFSAPVLEVQDFPGFLEKLPPSCFNQGISHGQVMELFDEYDDFLKGDSEADAYFNYWHEQPEALTLGLVTLVDTTAMTPAELWNELSGEDLEKNCTANGIALSRRRDTMIKRLVEKNIPFPYRALQPTELLRECYHSFVDLYIQDIRQHTDHFHPLYFQPLWEEVERSCDNSLASKKAEEIGMAPYWHERLCQAVRL